MRESIAMLVRTPTFIQMDRQLIIWQWHNWFADS